MFGFITTTLHDDLNKMRYQHNTSQSTYLHVDHCVGPYQKILTYYDLPDPGLSQGKTRSKRFQKRLPAHHKNTVKTNENPKINPDISGKKVIKGCCDPDEVVADTKDCLSDTLEVISKLIRVKLIKSPGDINYRIFPPG